MTRFHLEFIGSLFGLIGLTCLATPTLRIQDPVSNAYLSEVYEVILQSDQTTQIRATRLYVNEQMVVEKPGWQQTIAHNFGPAIEAQRLVAEIVLEDESIIRSEVIQTRGLKVDLEATARVILVTASVRARNNRPLTGLQPSQFEVFEDNRLLEMRSFSHEDLPLDLVVLLDTSSSLRKDIEMLKQAAITFFEALHSSDRVMLYEVKNQPRQLISFTHDRKQILRLVEGMSSRGETGLFDGLLEGLDQFSNRQRGRRAMILFTDGRDSTYEGAARKASLLRQVIQQAQTQEVTIYTLGLGKNINAAALARMAEETGGRFFFADKPRSLPGKFSDILLDLKHQYVLGVIPHSTRSGFHQLRVKVKKRGAKVLARKGYAIE